MNLMKNNICFFVLIILICNISNILFSKVLGETNTETFLNSIVPDLPDATIGPCRTGGVLQDIFLKTPVFKSGGNSYFIDQKNQKIAIFERAKVSNINNTNKEISVDLYVQVNGVTKEDIAKLLLPPRELVFVKNARAKYYIKVKEDLKTDLYEFDGLDDSGQEIDVVVKTFVKRVGTIRNNGKKFIVIDGKVKIHIPVPPKKVISNSIRDSVFENSPAIIECKFIRTPVHDIDLTDIGTAYDQNLADAIIQEATKTGENELPDDDI